MSESDESPPSFCNDEIAINPRDNESYNDAANQPITADGKSTHPPELAPNDFRLPSAMRIVVWWQRSKSAAYRSLI